MNPLKDDSEKQAGLKATRIYSVEEFDKMVAEERIVVAYQGGLYDMSNFTGHPGGVGRLQVSSTRTLIPHG